MNAKGWFTFADSVAFLRSANNLVTGMVTVYRKRESIMEDLFEGVILVPHDTLNSELKESSFARRFMPSDYRRRLNKFSQHHFLGLTIRRFAALRRGGHELPTYVDSSGKLAANRDERSEPGMVESLTILRADILQKYCQHYELAALWVTDSHRYSERRLAEYGLRKGVQDFPGQTFCYCQGFGVGTKFPPLRTRSWIYGKRLLSFENSNGRDSREFQAASSLPLSRRRICRKQAKTDAKTRA